MALLKHLFVVLLLELSPFLLLKLGQFYLFLKVNAGVFSLLRTLSLDGSVTTLWADGLDLAKKLYSCVNSDMHF